MTGHLLRIAAALTLSTALTAPVMADGTAGAYLAGRSAAVNSDYTEAANYYTQALARDTSNVELMENAALAYLALGRVERAMPLARRMEEQGQNSEVARLVITANLAGSEGYKELLDRKGGTTGISPWVDGLVKAWSHLALGDKEAAMAGFDTVAKEPSINGFVMYHKALALASVGDFEAAEALFSNEAAGSAGQTRRGTIAHAEVLAQLGKFDDAITVIKTAFANGTDPELDQLVAKYERGDAGTFDFIRTPQDGMAEIYFTFAAVLRSESAGNYYVLLYARVARYLRPDHVDALLLSASLLEALEQFDLAIDEYKSVPADNPAYHASELGRVGALRQTDRAGEAIEVLEQLSKTHGQMAVVHSTLGDVLRGEDDFDGAIAAYDRALERVENEGRMRWVLHYTRGIAHERNDDFANAEIDFRAALAINPEQPQVLNYLGYSLVEEQRNLDEALDMIERAVKASPDSGYIVDSLGWVFYRLGRYEEAVVQMERAVQLLPIDPVVNDHLGDVFWAVGRDREAEFQWARALSFIDPDDANSEADPERIRRKIEVGLDVVLDEEGAEPLKRANDG